MTPENQDHGQNDERNASGGEPEKTRGERAANPTPPATDALTSEDVQDSPQLPPESQRGTGDHDG